MRLQFELVAATRRVVGSFQTRRNASGKRLNRLSLCFSKKLRDLEAAFAMFAAYYNYCWQTRMPGTSGKMRPSAAMMPGLAGHVWSFDELFETVLGE